MDHRLSIAWFYLGQDRQTVNLFSSVGHWSWGWQLSLRFTSSQASGLRYAIALVMGIASGAAMIPFSIVKEANPPEVKGSASGAMNFLCFMVTALLSPILQRQLVPLPGQAETLSSFQHGLVPLAFGIVVAIMLSFFLRETGHAASRGRPGCECTA